MNSKILKKKTQQRVKRKLRIRAHISGTHECPRVTIFRSNRYLSVQAIDDTTAKTLCAISGKSMGLNSNTESAKKLGAEFAKTLKGAKVNTVVFDRNGYEFHGVVAAFATSLRENEISF